MLCGVNTNKEGKELHYRIQKIPATGRTLWHFWLGALMALLVEKMLDNKYLSAACVRRRTHARICVKHELSSHYPAKISREAGTSAACLYRLLFIYF